MAQTIGYWDYVKAAFKQRVRLPLLGHMPANYLALFACGVLGLINPGFWFLGAALEVVYLGLLAGNERYQKLVRGRVLLKEQQGSEQRVQRTVTQLSPQSAERYRKVMDQCRMILGITAPADQAGMLEDMRAGGLNQLLWLFLRLLSSREVLLATLAQVERKTLEADVARLQEKLAKAAPDSPLARSVKATLEIQTMRLENLGKAQSGLEVIDAELERIEQQVRLIREEAAVSGGPEFLSARLDAVSATLTETSRWMDQHAEFFTALTAEDAIAAPPGLAPAPKPKLTQ